MKKFLQIIAAIAVMFSVGLAPALVYAQGVEEIEEITAPPAVDALPSTGADGVKGVEPTGFAPSGQVARNAAVFIGGSLIGVAVGFGVIQLRKNSTQ
jgi:hypothetical protein